MSAATARLAVAVRTHTEGLARSASGSRVVFTEFCSRVDESPSGERAACDFALCQASLAVVLEYWRITGATNVERAIDFASCDPLCGAVRLSVEASESAQSEVASAGKTLAVALAETGQNSPTAALVHFLEPLMAACDARTRREMGMYFTPAEIVDYLIDRTDDVLSGAFGLPLGLGDASSLSDGMTRGGDPFIRILDPALGSGAFLLAVVRKICERWRESDNRPTTWSDYVSRCLLPNMVGCELAPAAYLVANLLLSMELINTGFEPRPGDRLRLHLGDCLSAFQDDGPLFAQAAPPFTVVVGNPPYRSLSKSEHRWISQLMRGAGPAGEEAASYFHIAGKPLGERKTWLHDDYVKFFRFAQWQIERAGAGVVAFVTNHGFLDNPTFRGMRAALTETFDHVEVIDLHGNAKKSPAGSDESVFETSQGMATTVAWRTGDVKESAVVRRGDLLGTRQQKFLRMASAKERPIEMSRAVPRSPHFLFTTNNSVQQAEYEAGFRLCDIMPVNTTAAVTARDWFVVDIRRDRLEQRLHEFADLSIPDDEIRARYFQRGRSSRYPPGDTRGWKLSDARRQMAEDSDWRKHIRRCWYRPFDRRWIFWAPWMIDWPRENVMRHLCDGNPALICRRQSVAGRPCNFFWIADDVVLDGYIRSDNRGSESVFPLYLRDESNGDGAGESGARANFTSDVVNAGGATANSNTFDAAELFHYIYALFHSPTYRQRYAGELAVDFPRVLLASDLGLWRQLASLGATLASAHLMRSECRTGATISFHGNLNPAVAAGYPKFDQERVYVNPDSWFDTVTSTAWEFRVGAHQVLRKWLKDRRNLELSANEVDTYASIVETIQTTLKVMRQVDETIEEFGGFPRAFQTAG